MDYAMPEEKEKLSAKEPQLTWFTAGLKTAEAAFDGLCDLLQTLCEFLVSTGRYLLSLIFIFGVFQAITAWRVGPSEEPKTFLLVCTLGILSADFGLCALKQQDLISILRFPVALAVILYSLPIEAISSALQKF